MTSCLMVSAQKRLPIDRYYCKITTSGYGSNFFNFLMCYLYARKNKKTLYLNDTNNNISSGYHLILDTIEDLPGIQYTTALGTTLQQMLPVELKTYFESLSEETLKQETRRIFRFRPSVQAKIDVYKKKLPAFDCGVHIRTGDKITTGEMKAIPLDSYLQAIREYQISSGKQELSIYVMTDSLLAFKQFREKAEKSWQLYNVPSPIGNPTGHVQSNYNKQSIALKTDAFHHFLAEIQILQNCSYIVCTFSSNIGRFVNLMTNSPIRSLD